MPFPLSHSSENSFLFIIRILGMVIAFIGSLRQTLSISSSLSSTDMDDITLLHYDPSSTTTNLFHPSSSSPGTSTNETQLVYVHVGKTGGDTLDLALRSNCMWRANPKMQEKCLTELEHQDNNGESQVSQKTILTVHCFPRRGLTETMKDVTGYLISIRNPLTRVVSAFNTGHPENESSGTRLWSKRTKLPIDVKQFYVDCFPTVEDLAMTLSKRRRHHDNNTTPRIEEMEQHDECYQLGVRVLNGHGTNLTAGHLSMNYAYYDRMVVSQYPGRDIWVLRTEHLWEDLSKVDQLLGGTGHFARAGEARTHKSERHTVRQGLSTHGTWTMCCYLAQELQIYEDWLRRAVNLSPDEKDATMAVIYDQCGVTEGMMEVQVLSSTRDTSGGIMMFRDKHSTGTATSSSFLWMDWAANNPLCIQ